MAIAAISRQRLRAQGYSHLIAFHVVLVWGICALRARLLTFENVVSLGFVLFIPNDILVEQIRSF